MKILKQWWAVIVCLWRDTSSVPAEAEPMEPVEPPQQPRGFPSHIGVPDNSPVPEPVPEAEPVEPVRKPRANRRKTLANLLESLEHIEPLLMCKTLYAQNTAKTRSALMKVGPYILDPSDEAEGTRSDNVIDTQTLSTIMFVGFGRHAETDEEKWLPGEFFYAIKSPTKRNPYVSQPTRPHVAIYECGRALYDYKTNKLIWDSFYVAVGEDGKPESLLKRIHERVDVGGGSFVRVAWLEHDFVELQEGETVAEYCETLFCIAANFWARKDEQWSVSVRKNKRRMTFSVPMLETKHYFKNRNKIALTPTGKRKTIMHFVHEHERQLPNGKKTTIKEHIRGARKFFWNRFECAITSPKFHTYTSQLFDLAPEHIDKNADMDKFRDVENVAGLIAALEDDQNAETSKEAAI